MHPLMVQRLLPEEKQLSGQSPSKGQRVGRLGIFSFSRETSRSHLGWGNKSGKILPKARIEAPLRAAIISQAGPALLLSCFRTVPGQGHSFVLRVDTPSPELAGPYRAKGAGAPDTN